MQGLSRAQKQLSKALLELNEDAMLLEELDGFVAGLLVCPELIPPSDWLPLIWNREGGDDPVFDNLAHANKVMGLVKEHYNDAEILVKMWALARRLTATVQGDEGESYDASGNAMQPVANASSASVANRRWWKFW